MASSAPSPNDFQQAVLDRLDRIEADLGDINRDLDAINQRERWDERAWRVIQFAGSASITLSVAASLGLLFLIGKAVFSTP